MLNELKNPTAIQRKVIREIIAGSYRSGLKGRARRLARNTALAVGNTEAGYTNPSGGDRDSAGWRQERAMYYKNPTNIRAAVDRFYQEYKADANPKSSLGARAQAVQQSGTPHVWDSLGPLTRDIARRFDKGDAGGPGPRRDKSGKATAPKYVKGSSDFDTESFIRSQLGNKHRKAGDITHALLGELTDPNSAFRTTTKGKAIPGKYTKDPGKLKDKHSQARADVRGIFGPIAHDNWKGSKSAGLRLAKSAHLPFSSEKRSTVNTASGNVSDHYLGNKDSYAWDLSVSGATGTKKAREIAKKLGVKWQGGSWLNVTKTINGRKYRFQVGWNVPDHYDHIHLGVDRVDTPG